MRKTHIRVWAPLASGTLTAPTSGKDFAPGTAALHASCRAYAVHNSRHHRHCGRRGERSREQQRDRSVSLLRNASGMTTGTAPGVVSPSPHARAAFHSFARSRNAPFVSNGTTAASPLTSDAINCKFQPSHLHSNVHLTGGTERHGAPGEGASFPRGGAARNTSSGETTGLPGMLSPVVSRLSVVAAPARALDESSQHENDLEEGQINRGSARTSAVLREWTLDPPHALARGDHREGGPQSRQHRPERSRDNDGTESDANGSSAQQGRAPGLREWGHRCAQERRHDFLERAGCQTAVQISNRHLREYEQACLHAYRLLKQVEWSLVTWARARRQGQGHADSGRSGRSGNAGDRAPSVTAPRLRGREGAIGEFRITLAGEDKDAVDAHFFEFAGQIRRTLHQLTPRHFDAVREYRLQVQPRGDSSSTAAASLSRSRRAEGSTAMRPDSPGDCPQQLLLLRLLWRLLHIQHLFFRIGRRASLPRTAIYVYVQSSNCQYGIREVLRVLGSELARSTLSTSAHRELHDSCRPQWRERGSRAASLSAPPDLLFSNKELFQLFYAALCIPSEEAPGVPLYDPSVDSSTPRRGGTSDGHASASPSPNLANAETHQFRRECIATGGEVVRMPLDEWCVRWWAHQYSVGGRTGAVWTPPLSMGEAMDVLQACMYATTSVQVRATSALGDAAQQRHRPQQSHVHPFMYFETPMQGAIGGTRQHRTNSASAPASDSTNGAEEADSPPLPELNRRYRPQMSGVLGCNRMSLRIPYHLGQRYVEVLLTYLLTSASAASAPGRVKESATTATETVAAGMERLLRGRDHDAVRDVALLCTAILFFEVFSPNTAAFMAYAAPLCREQVELLSGHEISCVLLAYASLQRWERAGGACNGGSSTPASGSAMHADLGAVNQRADPLHDPTVAVRSASAASGQSPPLPPQQQPGYQSTDARYSSSRQCGAAQSSSSHEKRTSAGPQSPSYEPWHLFYITLASRAGHLSDTLSEDDVTRVLLAMELTGLEHDDLRCALQSSLRMRNMGRRVLYET